MISDLSDDDPRHVGPYRLLGRLGAGGMGVVYLASSPGDEVVALKLIRADLAQDSAFRARFRREVEAARRVGGLCTAKVRDADLDGSRPWLATDFVAGPSLADLVARHGPLPIDQQRALAIGLSEALIAVHGAGLVHRDLKPSNVLCSPAGPKLIDFGIARAADATVATLTGQLVGSPSWMAPEQIRGEAATPAMDMFALGSLLVFAATGRPPFGMGQLEAVMYRILNEAPDLGPSGALSPELVPMVGDLLARDPASRPSPSRLLTYLTGTSAGGGREVTALLDRTWVLPTGETITVPTVAERPVPKPAAPRYRRKALGAAAAAVMVVSGLVATLVLDRPANGDKLSAVSSTTRSPVAAKDHPRHASPTTRAPNTTVPSTTVPRTTVPSTTVPRTTVPSTPVPALPSALTVVKEYLAAINAHDFRRAWDLGGKNLTPDYTAFVHGFASTLHSRFTGPRAQGNKVYLTLIAEQDSGERWTYRGDYVVDNGIIVSADMNRTAVDQPTAVPALPSAPSCAGTTPAPKPRSILFGCASGADELFPIRWTVWTSTSAGGVATESMNNCVPDCASGTSTTYPVNVQLSSPGYVNGAYVFRTITTYPLSSVGQGGSWSDPGSSWGAG